MDEFQVGDALVRTRALLERAEPRHLWRELQALERRGSGALQGLGMGLLEAECRRLLQVLCAPGTGLSIRPLMVPLAQLARAREGTAALFLQQLRQWEGTFHGDPPTELYRAIGLCGAAGALATLLEAKVFGGAAVREGVAQGLGEIGPDQPTFPEARLLLADLLLNDPVTQVRTGAARALDRYWSERDQRMLLKLSLESDPELRELLDRLRRKNHVSIPASSDESESPTFSPERTLRYYVRELRPGSKIAFYKEFERSDAGFVEEGCEDRELIDPAYSARSVQSDGCIHYTLHDGAILTEHPDGSLSLPLGRHDWRTRNGQTGVLTIRVPVDRPFEPRGTLQFRPEGSLRLRLDDGTIEEEHPDGRRIVIDALGLIQIISPRLEQGIQVDVHQALLSRQTSHAYVLLEERDGDFVLFGGEEELLVPPADALRAVRLPWGALWISHRDRRVTREVFSGETSQALVGGRTVTFVPRSSPGSRTAVRTTHPDGEVRTAYSDGSATRSSPEGEIHYEHPWGERTRQA